MTDDELIKLSRENLRKSKQGSLCELYDEAFIKGYKLGRPKWHDLRKNPLDLPTENCTVLIYTDWQGMELKTFFVDTRLFENLTFREVIAWCEIPKYTEE